MKTETCVKKKGSKEIFSFMNILHDGNFKVGVSFLYKISFDTLGRQEVDNGFRYFHYFQKDILKNMPLNFIIQRVYLKEVLTLSCYKL